MRGPFVSLNAQNGAFWSAIVLCFGLAVVQRLLAIGMHLPLWMDESFAAYFSTRPDFDAFLAAIRRDTNPPLYFLIAWLWPFKTDEGLRALSGFFVLAAASMPLFWPTRLTIYQRAAWAALLVVWLPGQLASANARPGALLLMLATAQTVAFINLLDGPYLRRAVIWTSLAGLAIATHYFAAVLGLAQGLAYVWVHRARAVRTWPALIGLGPVAAVFAWHYPFLKVWADPDLVWYSRLNLGTALSALSWPLHKNRLALAALAIILLLARCFARPATSASASFAAVSSALALLVVVVVAFIVPMLTPRYLTPLVPGVLLGVVLLAGPPLVGAACALVLQIFTGPVVVGGELAWRSRYGIEDPARFLVPSKPNDVLVAIDWKALSKAVGEAELRAVAERPFRQAGLVTRVRFLNTTGDPRAALFSQSSPFIWVHDQHIASGEVEGWHCYRTQETMACAREPRS